MSDEWEADLAVTTTQLVRQLEYFAERGYTGSTFSDLPADGSRRIVVTFDDGFRSVLKARPILEAVGFPGTVFVVTAYVSSGRPFDWAGVDQWLATKHSDELHGLTWEECADLRDSGWEIGSHTITHPVLPLVDAARRREELTESRREIEARLGSCTSLAYPYGQATAGIAAEAAAAGYGAACTLRFADDGQGPLLQPRVGVSRTDSMRRTALKAHPMMGAVRGTAVARLADRWMMTGSSRQSVVRGGA